MYLNAQLQVVGTLLLAPQALHSSNRSKCFHPIYIGDIYNQGRYRIINKLGLRSYSTVWLITDLHLNRFASLKVLSAYSSSVSSELHISQHLQQQQAQPDPHPSKAHMICIFDTFMIHGPNGTHHSIVTDRAANRTVTVYGRIWITVYGTVFSRNRTV
ncbi:hypothetical protein BDQ17DRAFT_1327128 [Cyathus striatus]|nr:hypothetical protein BDQ17DRAFT_1327128 [Cyathus striatus]